MANKAIFRNCLVLMHSSMLNADLPSHNDIVTYTHNVTAKGLARNTRLDSA